MGEGAYEVIVIGGGAAGLMAAIQAGKRGKRTLLIEHSHKVGAKIGIAGGGRCNFTNINASSANYLSQNRHFAKSALAGFTQYDFIDLVESYKIPYHEKTLGQLFCNDTSDRIINMLLDLCKKSQVTIKLDCKVSEVSKEEHFTLKSNQGTFTTPALIIACGGLSIPKLGASDFGYRIAEQFGLNIIPTRPALVPLTVLEAEREMYCDLSGVSNPSVVRYKKTQFRENILFTHKGLSGPAILQISSYLERFSDEAIHIDLLPDRDLKTELMEHKSSKQTPAQYLKGDLPKRLIDHLAKDPNFTTSLANLKKASVQTVAERVNNFTAPISNSGGYNKAEVTAGGVDTNELSSKTMESKKVPGLYFIGEVVDVTGWLGGYNFQWAWSSGYAAGVSC